MTEILIESLCPSAVIAIVKFITGQLLWGVFEGMALQNIFSSPGLETYLLLGLIHLDTLAVFYS